MVISGDEQMARFQEGVNLYRNGFGRYLVFSTGLNIIRPDGTGLVSLHPPGIGEVEFADWGPA